MSQMFLQFSFVLVGAFAVMMLQPHAQDQSGGFISIDCGQQNKEYTQSDTEIRYIPDTDFIETGEIKAVQQELNYQQQYEFVRIFRQGKRNCYKINIKRGQKYLIRASFLYGNYDRENILPQFQLHLGASVWDSVVITDASTPVIKELIHIPMRNYIHICLVNIFPNIHKGIPFISTLELRPLRDNMYPTEVGSSSALVTRRNMATTTTEYRYPDDVNDRIWTPLFFDDYTELSTSSYLTDTDKTRYQVPSNVMSTAATPKDISGYLTIRRARLVNATYNIYLHFAELRAGLSRELSVSINGKGRIKLLNPNYLSASWFRGSTTVTTKAADGQLYFSIYSMGTSYGPILNAYEIYMVKEFLVPETNQEDVEAITNLKSTYKIVKNWQGDPCNPQFYLWEGVNCSYSHNDSSRIISLNLSSSGLTGEIADYIANLTMLHTLDLSNNKLSGQIPEYLSSQLPELKILKIEKNELTGSVPAGIIAKRNDGGLSLSLCGNPSLSGQLPCEKKKKKKKNQFLIPVVVIITVMLWVSSIAAAILWKSKHFHAVWKKYWRLGKVACTEINQNRKGHDVFLSFRGLDTRTGFARNLYEALEKKGIKTFFDDKKLKKGDEIAVTLVEAIEASEISIILFSENYVSSSWCLGELVKILECKKSKHQRVIPVFYKVNPADIRHQTGSFSLKTWIDKGNVKVPVWQKALTEVASLSGFHYTSGYEIETIDDIVNDIDTSDFSERKKKNSLDRFDTICPPDGDDELVVYMTSSAKDKNFQICQSMLQSLNQFDLKLWQQRDVSIRKFRRELKKLVNKELPPPRLFVKGKYVGGYDEVSKLIKQEPWFCETLVKFSRRDEVNSLGQNVVQQEEAGSVPSVRISETEIDGHGGSPV